MTEKQGGRINQGEKSYWKRKKGKTISPVRHNKYVPTESIQMQANIWAEGAKRRGEGRCTDEAY